MATAAKSLVYPELPPVGTSFDAGLKGLGANWNGGGEGITPWVDYIRFIPYRPEYNGKAVLESFKEENKGADAAKAQKSNGPSIFLYMPSNIAIAYGAMYNNTKFGMGGLMAAQMLGGSGSGEEIAKTLQNSAAGATPEAGFRAVSDAANALSQFIGVEGSTSANDLAAVTQGRIFNPYEEVVFNGVSFRAHNFQFKLVARNKKEAEVIDGILKQFKSIMLPSYNSDPMGELNKSADNTNKKAAAADSTSKDGAGTLADKLTPDFSNIKNRYLNVPSRVQVEFVRIQNVSGKLGAVETAKTVTGLFKMKDCVIDGVQVNYTPDGGYVNTNDGFVPAIDLSISLKEISLVTFEDVQSGY